MTVFKTIPLAIAIASTLLATLPVSAQPPRYTPSAAGDEITDSKTGLIWKRCSEGMTWDNTTTTCTGTASTFTHEQALVQARDSGTYRLPNVKELSSIVDDTRINPSIDITAFPATVSDWYWTSTPYAGISSYAWNVDFYGGYVDYYGRGLNGAVRLVR